MENLNVLVAECKRCLARADARGSTVDGHEHDLRERRGYSLRGLHQCVNGPITQCFDGAAFDVVRATGWTRRIKQRKETSVGHRVDLLEERRSKFAQRRNDPLAL